MSDDQLPFESDSETIVEKEYRGSTERLPTEVIVDAVAEAAGVDPLDLPPMHDFVDPDAVNKLFSHDTPRHAAQYLSFKFDVWIVSIHAVGTIRVRDVIHPLES